MPTNVPPPSTERLCFARFTEDDCGDLARLLADPEITRMITANASGPERCLVSARKRIGWHNGSWDDKGYGVWALRGRTADGRPEPRVIGWCGFAPPDLTDHDPEILYGLSRDFWGRGLATEAARAAIDWLFRNTDYGGVSAVILGRLNPASGRTAEKLGMVLSGTMSMEDFLSTPELARDVLAYEIWRLREGDCLDPEALLFQAPYKAGQIASLGLRDPAEIEAVLCDAARARGAFDHWATAELEQRVRGAFQEGLAEAQMDVYHLPRPA